MDAKELPAHPSLDQYKKQAKDLLKSCQAGDAEAIRRAERFKLNPTEVSLAGAQFVIAREHGFESWPKFKKHIESIVRQNSPVSNFESAADAVVAGDITVLTQLLREDPKLIRARSTRSHRSTLLHYVGANGVEDFRQKTPTNAVEVARILLNAGAEVDADNGDYGGRGTALGLVATSVHPARMGLQIALLETLLDAGASPDGLPGGWNPVIAALHNGRGFAAEFLAARGARLDLEGAAGVGRLDAVESFFDTNGHLKPPATQVQMEDGFLWACEYGHIGVVEFLLQNGLDVATKRGCTGLHWAAFNAHVEMVKLLLNRNAPIDVRDQDFDGTPLGWALYGWGDPPPESERSRYPEVVASLVGAGAKVEPQWLTHEKIRADSAMAAALRAKST